jgi:flagella basal body P-ring formation protein FlgA
LSLFVSGNSVDKQVENYLSRYLSAYVKFEYTILNMPRTPGEIELQDGKEFKLNRDMVYIPVSISDTKNSVSSFISVKVKLYKYVLVASQSLKSKTDLNETMFEMKLVDVAALRGNPVESSSDLKLLRNKVMLNQGDVLLNEEVEKMPVVFSGDKLTAVKNSGSVVITVLAFAREEGGINDRIKIKTVDNKQFTARVLDKRKVLIEE